MILRSNLTNKILYLNSSKTSEIDLPIVSDFFSKIYNNSSSLSSFDQNIINPGLIHFDQNILVYEKPPAVKNIFFIPKQVESISSNPSSEETLKIYSLPVPWQVYFVKYDSYTDPYNQSRKYVVSSVYMYFSNSSIYSTDQELYLPPLPNFYCNGNLCRPMFDNMDDITRYPNSIQGLIASSYDWVWNSGTNADLTEATIQPVLHHYDNYDESVYSPSPSILPQNPAQTYYGSYDYINHLYSLWEKVDLDDIINYSWPYVTPDFSERYINYYNNCTTNYFREYVTSGNYIPPSSTQCCEDCQYYDEDGDIIEGECVEGGQCSCHESYSFTRDVSEYHKFLKTYSLLRHSSVSTIFSNISLSISHSSASYNDSFMDNLVSSIELSCN